MDCAQIVGSLSYRKGLLYAVGKNDPFSLVLDQYDRKQCIETAFSLWNEHKTNSVR